MTPVCLSSNWLFIVCQSISGIQALYQCITCPAKPQTQYYDAPVCHRMVVIANNSGTAVTAHVVISSPPPTGRMASLLLALTSAGHSAAFWIGQCYQCFKYSIFLRCLEVLSCTCFTSASGLHTDLDLFNMMCFLHTIGIGHHAVIAVDDKHQLHKCIHRHHAIMLIEMVWLHWS